MPLSAGTRLGSYEVIASLGAGGMGEVYRARDAKLNRDVAIKILPELFADDPQRLARFEREARALAALNHPNIAQIYGFESGALVMELVDGEDLSQRIRRGPIPVAEALPIARQIAEALEAAHEQGIIHRDLKPANVKVREDGTVKVLDFGLAKAMAPEDPSSAAPVSNSPTLTARATQLGMVLGTAAYMAPEQARGKAVDRRADVWAFGTVLYEMLTGRRAFEGDDVSDVLAAVLRQDIEWKSLPDDTPEPIHRLLRRCLERDRRERSADMTTARIEIRDAMSAPAATATPVASARAAPLSRVALLLAAIAVAIVAAAVTWILKPAPDPPARQVVRFSTPLPDRSDWNRAARHVIAISPDGSRVAYVADQKMFVRALDQLESTPLATVADPTEPVFSPDGQWIAFFAGGNLMKVAISGGAPIPIAAAGLPAGASWSQDWIVFAADTGIMRVSANGGTPELAVQKKEDERLSNPSLVLDGRYMLFSRALQESTAAMQWDDAEIVLEDLTTRERRTLVRGGTDGRLLAPHYLVYARGTEILALALDLGTLQTIGTPVRLAGEVARAVGGGTGSQQFSVSSSGTLVYVKGGADERQQLVWMSPGRSETALTETGAYLYPRLSPEGSRIAYSDGLAGNTEVYVLEWARKAKIRLTTTAGTDTSPIWTPNGARIAFSSSRQGQLNIYWQAADGTGTAERLTTSPNAQYPYAFTPAGDTLLYSELHPKTTFDIHELSLSGDRKSRPLVATSFDERRPALSPDGKWMAYQSDELGSFEVHVRPYPDVDRARYLVSAGGGASPMWAPDSKMIYYRHRGRVLRVRITTAPEFKAGVPEPVIDGLPIADAIGMSYDLAPPGERFVVVKPVSNMSESIEYRVIVNWIEEVKARVGR